LHRNLIYQKRATTQHRRLPFSNVYNFRHKSIAAGLENYFGATTKALTEKTGEIWIQSY